MVMMELSESEKPPPDFSAPFAAPSLRWACKKRLRGFNPDVALRLPSSPSRSPLRRCSPPLGGGGAAGQRAASHPSVAEPTPSDQPRFFVRLPVPRREDAARDEEPPLGATPPRTDLSSVAPTEMGRSEDKPGPGGDAAGRSLRSRSGAGEVQGQKKRRVELWVPLSKGEIDEDFFRMTGSKPPRRCRRRVRPGSDLLNGIFPGSWLPNTINAGMYKVSEPANPRKAERSKAAS